MTKKQKITYNVLRGILTALFLFTGFDKLRGDPMAIAGFALAGLPVWFVYMIGIGEFLGAIGLWVRPVFRYAYEGLFIVLAGAIGTTLVFISPLEAVFPLIVAVLLGIVVWLNGKGPEIMAEKQSS